MKRLLLPAIILTALLSGFRYPEGWKKFTSKEGHYSINFPVTPTESSETDTAENNIPFLIHFATCSPVDTEVYLVGWINMEKFYPKDKSVKQVLEESRDGGTRTMHAANVTTLNTYLGENPYIEFTFATNEYIGKERIYIINKCQYSIISLGSLATGITPQMDRFITSFRYLP